MVALSTRPCASSVPVTTAPSHSQVVRHDEFIFYHVVGCSRQSSYVTHMLRRLLTELKEHFELSRQVPDSEEKLSWDLPRFLELAVRKGRVILIIDGVHRLRTGDGTGDGDSRR